MDSRAEKILERVAADGLEKCVAKLSRIAAGSWSVAGVKVSCRTMEEALRTHAESRGTGAAVYFEVKGEFPFTSMVVFRPEDIDTISRGFMGFSFSKLPSLTQAHEMLLSELANIVVNSMIGALSGVLKRGFLRSAPKCVQGEPQFLLEALWTAVGREGRHSLVAVSLDLRCDKDVTRSELITLIPESMEKALLAGGPID